MKKVLLLCATAALAVGVFAAVAVATHTYTGGATSVQVVSDEGPGGNAECPANTIAGPKLDPPANYSNGILSVTISGKTLSWAFTQPPADQIYDMAVVIVKGGPNSAIYTYDYTVGGLDDSDSGLTAPNNPNGGGQPKDYGLSNIKFCFDRKGGGDN